MPTFRIDDMTCGHCAATVTHAIRGLDPDARVDVRLADRLVHVQTEQAAAADVVHALGEAGYTALLQPGDPAPTA